MKRQQDLKGQKEAKGMGKNYKRQQDPEKELIGLKREIRREIENWEYINQNGCNDPFWSDGTNLNLTRNHIIYAKQKIKEICEEHRIEIPEELYLPTPPEVNDYYMANLKQKRRLENIGHHEKITTKRNKYDRNQLSMFLKK